MLFSGVLCFVSDPDLDCLIFVPDSFLWLSDLSNFFIIFFSSRKALENPRSRTNSKSPRKNSILFCACFPVLCVLCVFLDFRYHCITFPHFSIVSYVGSMISSLLCGFLYVAVISFHFSMRFLDAAKDIICFCIYGVLTLFCDYLMELCGFLVCRHVSQYVSCSCMFS